MQSVATLLGTSANLNINIHVSILLIDIVSQVETEMLLRWQFALDKFIFEFQSVQ